MNQSAIVKKEIREGLAEVSLLRQVECGLSCGGNCASCHQHCSDKEKQEKKK